jgi:hypothetical protein
MALQIKVKKLLETRTDTPELVESLKALSTFYGENTPAARRGATACPAHAFLPHSCTLQAYAQQ